MTDESTPAAVEPAPGLKPTPKWLCPFFMTLGLVSTGIGILGVFVPGLPTTIFLIIALWAFSRSSDRLKLWLWNHPKFGHGLRAWHLHRVIPRRAKIAAVSVMVLSLVVLVAVQSSWTVSAIVAAIMVPIALWICTRRSVPPVEATASS